jgi:parallel beta-helix repeat protein
MGGKPMRVTTLFLLVVLSQGALAGTLRVPQDHKSIQAAVDAAQPGDTVMVSPGNYKERIRLKPGIIVRSAGDDAKGELGLKRAEATLLDGGGEGSGPGVVMAEGSSLDGFTVTNVGNYDDARWKRHYDSQGEELADEEGAVGVEGSNPAISIEGVTCTVVQCIVHHNGSAGIGVVGQDGQRVAPIIRGNVVFRNMGGGIGLADGAEAIVRENTCYENLRAGIGCRNSSPVVTGNTCYGNVRAGIGCREGATPVLRGNKCYRNRRAGIGIRMKGTSPVVEDNECYENAMAGIGNRDGAEPIIRNNRCYKNKMAGIGTRSGARPLIVGNECRENEMAGIGVRQKAHATLVGNRCIENKLVAVGVVDGATAHLADNELVRTGGVPPLVAVRQGASAVVRGNRIRGGGVAGVLVEGTAHIEDNEFVGKGKGQGSAVWVWAGSTVTVCDNQFEGYRNALNAGKSNVTAAANTIRNFDGPAIIVKQSTSPAHVYGNTIVTQQTNQPLIEIDGPTGIVADNEPQLAAPIQQP